MANFTLRKYLQREVSVIVNILFNNLKIYNIDIDSKKEELNDLQLENYRKIYIDYEKNLINLQKKAIEKYGYTKDFNNLFSIIIYIAIDVKLNQLRNSSI